MSAATRVANKRFETCTSSLLSTASISFPPRQVVAQEDIHESLQDLVGLVNETWTESVSKLSQLKSPSEGSKITQPMWDLLHGGYLDFEIVENYLQLLRPTSRHVEILPARMLRGDQNSIHETDGIDHPAVIPLFYENHWAFAVAYSDCFHWYDSAPGNDRSVPLVGGARPVIEGWQSPRYSDPADAGVFMLMGIKLIMQRKPHLSQGVADELIRPFRAGAFVELLCRKVNPLPTDLLSINLEKVIETGDLTLAANQISQEAALAYGLEQRPLMEDGLFVTEREDQVISPPCTALNPTLEPIPLSRNPMQPPVTYSEPPTEPSSAQTQPPANTSRKRRSPPAVVDGGIGGYGCNPSDDRKVILGNLSHGMHFKRSAIVSSDDDPFVLWALLRYSKTSGNLHRRYHAILFHKMMEDDVRREKMASSTRSKACMKRDLWSWKFWKSISDIGVKYGLGPLVTLCAFRNDFSGYRLSEEAQKPLIRTLETRLQNKSDMLRSWLQEASELCKIILVGPTPVSLFNIDKYNSHTESEITDYQYEFYVRSEQHRGPSR
ncbi:hypothetical protein FPOA_13985 [Fusarium poae]|uniref:Uncharacterized protein n=1 Tax=Fusarium poae TaxID=36050 RepID=A0A1B8A3S2_FUSPO|nr:hypothetical protein FPOA_13985 [Fusarium poae]